MEALAIQQQETPLFVAYHGRKRRHRIDFEQTQIDIKYFDLVIRVICSHFKVSFEELQSGYRGRVVCTPRHLAMYLLCKNTKLSLKYIGKRFGDRDHTSVINARDGMQDLIDVDEQVQKDAAIVIEMINTEMGINEPQSASEIL